ncbi:MAG: cytochrome c biogenesis protein ResB [Chloroflexi bacterium]|nr:cytochrome c biogenesis protein ResB [Chloroflexota bacterium]
MIAQTPRDPWRTVWQIATSDYLIAVLLLGITAGLMITTWLPQMPMANPVAYAQWLSETQARFENKTPTMQTLGLFNVTHSPGFRLLLTLVAGILLLRLIEISDRMQRNREMTEPEGEWHEFLGIRLSDITDDLRRRRYRLLEPPTLLQADRWPWADLFPLLAHIGGLLLLIGLLITQLWGWQTKELIIQSGQRVELANSGAFVAWDENTHAVTHSPGLLAFIEEQMPGIRAQASDGAEQSLTLQQSLNTEPAPTLTMALTEDQYFAIPEAQLVVRLAPHSNHITKTQRLVLVQVYRSPPGRLITETQIVGESKLPVDDIMLEFASVSYARLSVIFNPGLWPACIGLVILTIGLLGSIMWPTRKLWLQEKGDQIQAAGDLLPMLTRNREN